ncbi:MAG TPA: YggS family pyridoxal phosphate-dependent enzyme [Actinomycetota bacterium]|jgi:pyridoxal phosphate enzyme (YggS family)
MAASRDDVRRNLDVITAGVAAAADRAGRDPAEITVVAAAKTVPPEPVAWAIEAGVTAVGENYVQELRDARAALEGPHVRWHYIGTLASGTAHHVADLSDVVETVAGERAARRLAGRAARAGRVLDVLIEVDLTEERSGVPERDVDPFVELLSSLDGVQVRGLMTLPPLPATPEDSRPWFARLRGLRERLREKHPEVLDLSMGMSLDYGVAVEEGATMVRIGTALFGPRTS